MTNGTNNENTPLENDWARGRLNPVILGIAFLIGIPLYVIMAWVLQALGVGHPFLAGGERRIMVYALLSFIGLGSAVASLILRKVLMPRPDTPPGTRPLTSLILGLALAEVPAILGLVYFAFSYDWAGFLMLVAASVICFILHTLWPQPRGC